MATISVTKDNPLYPRSRYREVRYVCASLARSNDDDRLAVAKLLPSFELRRMNDLGHILQARNGRKIGLNVEAGADGNGVAVPFKYRVIMAVHDGVSRR